MFCDSAEGETRHIGYIIAGLWITLYSIGAWHGKGDGAINPKTKKGKG